MNTVTNRVRKIAAAHALVLGMVSLGFTWNRLEATPSTADVLRDQRAVEQAFALPDNEALLSELSAWVADETAGRVTDAIKAHPVSFEVFTQYHGDDVRQAVLEEIPYGEHIAAAATKNGVDSLLVAAVVEVESTFKPAAGSHKGAVGLMQILPSTAGKSAHTLRNPQVNLDSGTRYLHYLIERFDGDLELALAAYNAGPTSVLRYKGVPPFSETQNYVQKVLGIYVDHHRTAWKKAQTADHLLTSTRA
jgi:hypothetical protein